MKLKEVSVGVSRTLNLGNYESLRIESGAAASIDEGDGLAAVRAELIAQARLSLNDVYQEFSKKKDK